MSSLTPAPEPQGSVETAGKPLLPLRRAYPSEGMRLMQSDLFPPPVLSLKPLLVSEPCVPWQDDRGRTEPLEQSM